MNEQEIFAAALEQEANCRAKFLDEACGNDAELRRRIENLLQFHNQAGAFFEKPAAEIVCTEQTPLITETIGAQIGPYKLLQQLGEGGMGVVYMAEQHDPIRRKVALKIIKPGMDTRQVIARFEAERQALAMMDHVNIARVFDGGTTESGRPYFVMELVHGVPITKYCDDNHLTPRVRLELFVPVCHAIQHAHQKGIIHRDIKPSNVMVTLCDGKPIPKVIDFGVAKAEPGAPGLNEEALFTQYGTLVGTLEYMSPEQADNESRRAGVDTRSDIYSLGVLLYELLTGNTPLTQKRIREVAYGEILRMIKEEDPPKPSTRLSDSGEALASISAQRHMEPAKLTKLLRGELDWIVMKTLEKDRNRRYETANGFAADILRYLNDEPVQAFPPSAAYRFRKFARRNRVVLITAAIVFMALVLGTMGSTWQAIRAIRAEDQTQHALDEKLTAFEEKENALKQAQANAESAQQQRQRAQENLDIAYTVLDEIYVEMAEKRLPRQVELTPGDREFLLRALTFYEQIAIQDNSDSEVRKKTVSAYQKVGDIQKRLGQHDAAKQAYSRAIAIGQESEIDFPTESQFRHQRSLSHDNLADVLILVGEKAAAVQHFRQAFELRSKLADEFRDVPYYRSQLAKSFYNLGVMHALGDETAQAAQCYDAAVGIQGPLAQEFRTVPEYRDGLALSQNALGSLLRETGDRGAAIERYRRALELWNELVEQFPNASYRDAAAGCHHNLGLTLGEVGEQEESARHLRRAIELRTTLANEFPAVPSQRHNLAMSHVSAGVLLLKSGDRLAAAEQYRRAIDVQTTLAAEFSNVPDYQSQLGGSLSNLATILADQGDMSQARELLEQAIDRQKRAITTNPRNPTYLEYLHHHYQNLAETLARMGQYAESAALRENAIELQPDDLDSWYFQAVAYLAADNRERYRLTCTEMMERFGNTADPARSSRVLYACLPSPEAISKPDRLVQLAEVAAPWYSGNIRVLGAAEFRAGRYAQAIPRFDEAVRLKKANAWDWCFLAMAHHRLGHVDESQRWLAKALQWIAEANSQEAGIVIRKSSRWGSWAERIEVQHLYREAESLIHGN